MAESDSVKRSETAGREAATVAPMAQQTKSDVVTTPARFGESYAQAALTPTILGELGSSLANNASMKLNKRRGMQAGLNPSGDKLPPITNADKAYADAYQNQAQATLTNQAGNLFNEANENMAKLNKLTPSAIAEYQKTMATGLDDILKLAPNDVRNSLANQFTNEMQNSDHRFKMKMISDNHAEALASSNTALASLNEQTHTAALDGRFDDAAKLYENALTMIARGKNGGMYSPSQAVVMGKTAHLNYMSSLEIQKGVAAKHSGTLDEWYNKLADEKSKPEGVSWSEWETVRTNSAKYLAGVTSLSNQQQTLIASNGSVDIAQGTMNAEKMGSYQEQLKESPKLFNQLQIQYATQQRRTNKDGLATNFYASNWQNIDRTRGATPKKINDAAVMLADMYEQTSAASGHPISRDEAEYQVAANAAMPVPSMNDKITSYAKSGNPDLMMNALQTYNRLADLPGFKVSTATNDKNAMGTMHSFEHFIEQGLDATTAANKASLINSDKSEEKTNLINRATNEYLNSKGNTAAKLQSWAFNQAGISASDVVDDPTSVSSAYLGMFKDNMQWVDGNAAVALKMTNKAFEQAWGISHVNGKSTFGFLPPEKSIRLDEGAVPLMQLDIAEQIKESIKQTNQAHADGHYDWGYRVVERPGLAEYSDAKKSVRELGLKDPQYAYHRQIMDKFDAGKPVEIERYRNVNGKERVEKFTAKLMTNPWQGISSSTGELTGGYDIGLVNSETGMTEPFQGLFTNTNMNPTYNPSTDWIAKNYMIANGLNPSATTHEQFLEQYKAFQESQNQQTGLSKTLNTAGRGFR